MGRSTRGAMVVRQMGGAGRALLTIPNIRRRATNSWSWAAIRDTFSTNQVFESHRTVFTVGTSIASVLTAWAGYSLRHVQQSRMDKRLESIESSVSYLAEIPFYLEDRGVIIFALKREHQFGKSLLKGRVTKLNTNAPAQKT